MRFADPRFNIAWSRGAGTTTLESSETSRRRQSPVKTAAAARAAGEPSLSADQMEPDAGAVATEFRRSNDLGEVAAPSHTSILPRSRYKSYTLRGKIDKPWLDDERWHRPRRVNNAIMYTGFLLSITFSIWLIVSTYQYSKPPGKYCLIMADSFTGELNSDHWSYEVQTGGFEHGEFSWTTADRQNVFVDDEGLHIIPTLTTKSTAIDEVQLLDGYTVNLTSASSNWGGCTSPDVKMCAVTSNATLGRIIPPVRSARITTKGKKSIKYGRVEIVAKMPKGDWLWPAIWMMPEDSVYGQWPRSGQIDIAELRGNSRHYPRGRDLVTSTLHYGPDPQHDGYLQTYDTFYFQKRRTDFSDKFFTYGFEWNEEYMRMRVDHKSIFTISFEDKTTFWDRGMFQGMASLNGTMANNPWRGAGSVMAPFDQAFYLNLKVAAGAQHGYFYDNKFNKPWVDRTPLAAREFWNAREQWLPTWGNGTDRGMTIKSVKMWQQCG